MIDGVLLKTDFALYGENAILPTPPTGYTYSFSINGQPWDGTNITEDVTVTVKKFIIEIEELYFEGVGSGKYEYGFYIQSIGSLKGDFIVAAYGSDGSLIGMTKEFVDSSEQGITIEGDITLGGTPVKYKAMIWERLGKLKPIVCYENQH